ncbi:hypothetical protein LY76DRAFT_426952 [Colletotrichum caudatum]|nr:hypothetical protein LY76DRAFT_426952 [Colletotrichum caudatum]
MMSVAHLNNVALNMTASTSTQYSLSHDMVHSQPSLRMLVRWWGPSSSARIVAPCLPDRSGPREAFLKTTQNLLIEKNKSGRVGRGGEENRKSKKRLAYTFEDASGVFAEVIGWLTAGGGRLVWDERIPPVARCGLLPCHDVRFHSCPLPYMASWNHECTGKFRDQNRALAAYWIQDTARSTVRLLLPRPSEYCTIGSRDVKRPIQQGVTQAMEGWNASRAKHCLIIRNARYQRSRGRFTVTLLGVFSYTGLSNPIHLPAAPPLPSHHHTAWAHPDPLTANSLLDHHRNQR